MKTLRWASVGFAVVGLAALFGMARHREVSLVRAADLMPEMNFARVRIAGEVERDAYVGEKNGAADYVAFSVNDGSGVVRVTAYAAVARQMVVGRQIPRARDRVTACGTLALGRDGTLKLRLDSAGGLLIEPMAPRERAGKTDKAPP